MMDLVERGVTRFARVPGAPSLPAGDPTSVRVFRAAPAFFRYRLLSWFARIPLEIAGIAFGLMVFDQTVLENTGGLVHSGFLIVEAVGVAVWAVKLLVSLVTLRLDYRLRHYAVTDRSLRVREGVWHVREMTMTFANVQNIEMHQGPLQRWFGIADLRVQSAGGGSGQHEGGKRGVTDHHSAWFRGIADAPAVRELILLRLRRLRDAGLGDLDEAHHEDAHHEEHPTDAPVAAAVSVGDGALTTLLAHLRDEAAGLRAAAERWSADGVGS